MTESVLLTLAAACLLCFTWGTAYHFSRRPGKLVGTVVISVLSLFEFAMFAWQTRRFVPVSASVFSCALFASAGALWSWAIVVSRSTPPTLAFTDDRPDLLFTHGPYGFVRHPFYLAYMAFWVGTAVAADYWACWLTVAVIGIFYRSAARYEEAKFSRSALSVDYRRYVERTGMFLPRIWLVVRPS